MMAKDRKRINDLIALYYDKTIDAEKLATMLSYYVNRVCDEETIEELRARKGGDAR